MNNQETPFESFIAAILCFAFMIFLYLLIPY